MKAFNTSDPKQRNIFRKMYYNYIDELAQYSQRLRDEPVTQDDIHDIETLPLLERYFIENENGQPIGFMLFGFKENTHPETDWFIAEFYIQPTHRHKGYGTNAIKQFLQTHPGKYCYFVLKENLPAQKFWGNVCNKLKCQDITKQLVCEHTPDDCFFKTLVYTNQNS